MSQLFASGSQSIGVSASVSVLPINIQERFPLGWIHWISLQCKETFHAKMGTIKDRNGMDQAEDITKRWQEYTEELYKKIFMTQITTMV